MPEGQEHLIEYAEELLKALTANRDKYPIAPDAVLWMTKLNNWLNGYWGEDFGLEPPAYPRYD